MCGRFVIIPDNLKARFDIFGNIVEIKPNYNAAPSQHLPVITFDGEHNQLELMEWGLIPHWSKAKQTGYSMINARMETLLEKPTYKHPFKSHRCIMPASGFYEWQKTENRKQPYYITLSDQPLIGFAGIFDIWEDKTTGSTLKSYSIITTASRGVMETIHERTPVILHRDQEKDWLRGTDEAKLYDILKHNETQLELYPVSRLVNMVQNNDRSLIEMVQM
jgi:putative SOS response-associated peptidase YedK